MSAQQQQVVGLPTTPDIYIRHGWNVVAIPPKTKGPTHRGWNKREGCLTLGSVLPEGWGIGLCHAYSGTMALDIDHWDKTYTYFQERNIDLMALFDAPDSVAIDSGNPGHAKLIFAMPFGMVMPSKKVVVDGITAFELRCGTKDGSTVQDVAPPSQHPSGTTYRWVGNGHWQRLPTLPDTILNLWEELSNKDSERNIPNSGALTASWNEIVSATMSIDPDCDRKTWVEVGMAIHAAGAALNEMTVALALWDEWSRGSTTKYNGTETQWRSFKPDPEGIKVGTLFHHARVAGWRRPIPDISEMFKGVETTPEDVLKRIHVEMPPPTVDLSLWPTVLADMALEVSEEVGCDPVVPLMAGLAAVSAAADKRIKLQVTESWKVSPVLWLMTIGAPSDKKSPGSRPMFAPLKQLEIDHRVSHGIALLKWQGQEARYASQLKAYKEYWMSADAGLPNSVPPTVEDLAPEPKSIRLVINDATSQKVVHMAVGRERGFLLHLDEMNHWLSKLNDGRGTEDRGCWIQGYEAGPYNMDRVGVGSLAVENLAISIFGNCQPAVFKQHMTAASNDGLVQRFIPIVLNTEYTRLWNESVPEFMSAAPAYEAMIRRVFAVEPTVVKCSEAAVAVFRNFSAWYGEGRRMDTILKASPIYMTAVGKIEGTCLRLASLLHLAQHPDEPELSETTMTQTVAIMKQFVVPSLRYSFISIVGLKDELSTWITEHIIQIAGTKTVVSLNDIKRSARRQIEGRSGWELDQDIRIIMDELTESGYVTLFAEHGKHVSWAINAEIANTFKKYRKQIIDARQNVIKHFQQESFTRNGFVHPRLHNAKGYVEDEDDE